jgi:hypothetical protein
MRRAAHEALTKRAVQNYHPIQMKEATILVSSLLAPSANPKQDVHLKRLTASTMMTIVYDYPTIMSEDDHALEKIEKYNDRLGNTLIPGSYLVDMFPWMKHIPERSEFWLSFCSLVTLVVNTYGRIKSDSRNGSKKASEDLQKTLRCS